MSVRINFAPLILKSLLLQCQAEAYNQFILKYLCWGGSFSEFYITAYKWEPKCSDLGLHLDKQVQNFSCMDLPTDSLEISFAELVIHCWSIKWQMHNLIDSFLPVT